MSNMNWKDLGKALALMGIIITPIAMVLPDPYGKFILAIDAGLANGAHFLGAKSNGT